MEDAQERQLRLATEVAIRLGALALLIGWCGVILFPFLLPIAWGAIIAITLHGSSRALAARLGGRTALAAGIVVCLALAAVIVPAVVLGGSLAEEAQSLVAAYQAGNIAIPEPPDTVKGWPIVGERLHAFWLLASQNIEAALAKLQPLLRDAFGPVLGAAAGFGMAVLQTVFAVLISGVMLATADNGAAAARTFAERLGGSRGPELVDLSTAAIRGVTRGILGVALIQALFAGLLLMLAGVPGSSVLTAVMFVLCVLQLGVALVMIPAAIWLFANADTATAVWFTIAVVVVSPLDNVLKPLLMVRGLDVPVVVIFLGAIGGFLAQGIIGLFVGAVVLVVGYELLKRWLRGEPAPQTPAEAQPEENR